MSYIPKSAQRKIDQKVKPLPGGAFKAPVLETPIRLKQGQPGAGLWDVYLDGVRQHLCCVADVEQGFVIRYTHGSGNTPLTTQTEQIQGRVEIRRKGT